jgi:membrane-associated protease RseP (regulator of RpoE activity)
LLESGLPTIRAIGGAGAAGRVMGRMGRVQALQIGRFVLREPITMFAQDAGGAFANSALAGNIGAQIAMRFRTYLDYGRKRIILESSPMFDTPFDRAFSGLALRALGDDFRTFRVIDVLEDSPASDAGIQVGDVIASIDETPASGLTIFRINELFDVARTYTVSIRRGAEALTLKLTTRKMI